MSESEANGTPVETTALSVTVVTTPAPERKPSLADMALASLKLMPPSDFDNVVRQRRCDTAKLATLVEIENALAKGERVIIVKGDKVFPRVVRDVLALYRSTGWDTDDAQVAFIFDPNTKSGQYRFVTAQSNADDSGVPRGSKVAFIGVDDEEEDEEKAI